MQRRWDLNQRSRAPESGALPLSLTKTQGLFHNRDMATLHATRSPSWTTAPVISAATLRADV